MKWKACFYRCLTVVIFFFLMVSAGVFSIFLSYGHKTGAFGLFPFRAIFFFVVFVLPFLYIFSTQSDFLKFIRVRDRGRWAIAGIVLGYLFMLLDPDVPGWGVKFRTETYGIRGIRVVEEDLVDYRITIKTDSNISVKAVVHSRFGWGLDELRRNLPGMCELKIAYKFNPFGDDGVAAWYIDCPRKEEMKRKNRKAVLLEYNMGRDGNDSYQNNNKKEKEEKE